MKNWNGCGIHKITWALMVIGGLNWGLAGLGYFIGTNLNVVNLILGSYPGVENAIYLIVGLATIASLFGCRCKQCQVSGNGTM